jgi:Co/Zn/Cd efflux system component
VIVATIAVWLFGSGWPDLVVASVLLALFTRSATRVIRTAWLQMHGGGLASAASAEK